MQQHVLDDRVGALAVLHDLFEIALQRVRDLADFPARLIVEVHAAKRFSNSSISSTETDEKLLTKLSGFLISWAMPAVSWPSEASFSVCTRRSCAVRRSSSDLVSSLRTLSALPRTAARSRLRYGLVGEGSDKRNLLAGEGPHGLAHQNHNADRCCLRATAVRQASCGCRPDRTTPVMCRIRIVL